MQHFFLLTRHVITPIWLKKGNKVYSVNIVFGVIVLFEPKRQFFHLFDKGQCHEMGTDAEMRLKMLKNRLFLADPPVLIKLNVFKPGWMYKISTCLRFSKICNSSH